jgi:hypothetical protein
MQQFTDPFHEDVLGTPSITPRLLSVEHIATYKQEFSELLIILYSEGERLPKAPAQLTIGTCYKRLRMKQPKGRRNKRRRLNSSEDTQAETITDGL